MLKPKKKILKKKFNPEIIVFCCNWCSYAGADLAGVSRFQYPPNIRIIRVMCSGRVDPSFILKALKCGADGVLITGCHIGDCHYISGVNQTIKIVPVIQKNLEKMGIDPERLRLEFASAAEGAQFASIVNNYTDAMAKLGRFELTGEQKEKLLELKEKKAKVKKKEGKAESAAVSDDPEDSSA